MCLDEDAAGDNARMTGADAVPARSYSSHRAWRDAAAPLGLLLVGYLGSRLGAGPALGLGVLLAVAAGSGVSLVGARDRAWIWAASLPLAVRGLWADVAPTAFPPGLATCGDLLSPPAAWRVAEALAVVGVLAAAAMGMRVRPASLGLRLPSRGVVALSVTAPLLIAPAALALGPALARPFFAPFTLDLGAPWAIVPALLFATANGTMEEVLYRGALLSWGERMVGPRAALWLQAIVFGLAHGAGRDFAASPLPVVAVLVVAGVVAGLIVRRTGSLMLPIAVHMALDVPLYYYQACRLG